MILPLCMVRSQATTWELFDRTRRNRRWPNLRDTWAGFITGKPVFDMQAPPQLERQRPTAPPVLNAAKGYRASVPVGGLVASGVRMMWASPLISILTTSGVAAFRGTSALDAMSRRKK